ncbi:MAG: hypothetical protein ACFHX7_08150 [Pseudomonadota bacterium]
MTRTNQVLAILVALLPVVSACTSYQPVAMPADRLREELAVGNIVRSGDRVRIHLANGEQMSTVVTGLTESGLITSAGEIAFASVTGIDASVHDETATTVAVLGGSVIVGLILATAALSSVAFMY